LNNDETRLIERAQSGEQAAPVEIYERFLAWLYTIATARWRPCIESRNFFASF
jgi:hypothetical protein